MNFHKIFSCLMIALSLLTACDGKKKADPRKLTFGTSADYAPFEFFREGKIVGFDIDLMREIARRLNKEIEFKDLSLEAILGSLATNRLDGAISALTPTEERRKSVDFSKEYIHENHVMVCNGTSSIETVADLADATVGVQSGSSHETYVNDSLVKEVRLKVMSLAKIPDLIENMNARRLSCIVLGASEAAAIRKSRGNVKVVPLPGENGGYAITLPIGSPLTDKINGVLEEMEKDGFLDRLKDSWLEKP